MVIKYKCKGFIRKRVLYIRQLKHIIFSKCIVGRLIIKNEHYLNTINLF